MNIGDRVKVIDQDITGTIVELWDGKLVIEDDDSEFEDNRLEYRLSEVKPLKKFKVYASYTTCLDAIVEAVDEDEAWDIADDMDGVSFKDRGCGDWKVDCVVDMKEQA